jgi:hypothetical protein
MIMRFALYALLLALVAGLLHYLLPFVPWWTTALVALLLSLFIKNKPTTAFFAGFVGALLLWGGLAFYLSTQNDGILAARMGNLLGGLPGMSLPVVTGLLGGILGGLGGLTGSLMSRWFQ